MKIEMVGMNSIYRMEVAIVDTATYHVNWNGYDVEIRSHRTDKYVLVHEYVFARDGQKISGTKTINNVTGTTHSYGEASDLIKRLALRNAKTIF